MNKTTMLARRTAICLFMLCMSFGYAQTMENSKTKLPESVFGEWYGNTGNSEYNGLLIHHDFIEFGYRPFMYQNIRKDANGVYAFEAEGKQGDIEHYHLEILTKDSIRLKRGEGEFRLFVKHEDPLQSKRVAIAEVPDAIKGTWFTTDGEDNLEFTVTPQQFIFRDKTYSIEEIVHFRPNETGEYRFIVKNGKEYWMFYFKNWGENFLQVGFSGEYGDLYKAGKEYPNYRIDNISEYLTSEFPKALMGDWLKANGSNVWAFSFYYDYAVLDKAIWRYKAVEKNGEMYKITLTNNGKEKTIYGKLNNNKTASFGTSKQDLKTYTIEAIYNPDFQLANDVLYAKDEIFKIDSATYAGIIRGFDSQSGQKTGMVHVNNVFTGNQTSYLVEIGDDGRFSVKFPAYYPQQVFVRFPGYYTSVFVEPGKETWQLINANKQESLFFAGDLAQLNTDLKSLEFISRDRTFYRDVVAHIDDFSLEAYKEKCFSFYQRQIQRLDSVFNTRFVSDKARQVLDLELEYNLYRNILNYDISSKDRLSSKIDSTYINFLTPEIYNNTLAVVSTGYLSFINRLKFIKPMRGSISVTHPNVVELAQLLKSKNIPLTESEKEIVASWKTYHKENATALEKQKEFREKNQDVGISFATKMGKIIPKLTEEERTKLSVGDSLNFDFLKILIESKNMEVSFTKEELTVRRAQNNLLTEEEKERAKKFYTPENIQKFQDFFKNHQTLIQAYVSNELNRKQTEQVRADLGNSFCADVIVAQYILEDISRSFIPLTESELKEGQKNVSNPLIAKVIKVENDKMKAKIEANKTKTGFVAHETPTTEADNIFDAIISKYKGNVVFVDFWATWCGPCRSGMKKIKPLKEAFKNKDVVFVYITSPSSPETTYNNMIPNIKGEHYRVSKDEWNYLTSKFNISGIPHYLLLDKNGKIIKHNTQDLRIPKSLEALLETELKKS